MSDGCDTSPLTYQPVPGAFEPVEDVGAAGVVDLVERVSVGLLHRHGVAARGGRTRGQISHSERDTEHTQVIVEQQDTASY